MPATVGMSTTVVEIVIGIISEIPSSIDISELGALVIAWGI
jgi:hypothetical protein